MGKQGLIRELSLAQHPRVRARAAAAQLGIWGAHGGGWLLKRALSAPKRGGSNAPSSAIPPRELRSSGHCRDSGRGRLGVGQCPQDRREWLEPSRQLRGGTGDGHKLGECLTHFCTPRHEQPLPGQIYPNFRGWQRCNPQLLSLLAAGCPSWGQLGHPLHPLHRAPPKGAGKVSTTSLSPGWGFRAHL